MVIQLLTSFFFLLKTNGSYSCVVDVVVGCCSCWVIELSSYIILFIYFKIRRLSSKLMFISFHLFAFCEFNFVNHFGFLSHFEAASAD